MFKFMKELMSNKKKLDAYGTVSLLENCSAIIQRKLPEMLRDPGSFTIPCAIGEHTFKKALCDLGASINIMSLSVVKKLNLGEVTRGANDASRARVQLSSTRNRKVESELDSRSKARELEK